jgi:replicative DNA helicase
MSTKTLQIDRGNELAVLKTVVLTKDHGTVTNVIRAVPDHEFLVPEHQILWRVFRGAVQRAKWFDPEWIRRELLDADPRIAEFFDRLQVSTPGTDDVAKKLETLSWDARRHQVFGGPLQELVDALASVNADPARVQALAQRVTEGLRTRSTEIVAGAQLAIGYGAALRERASRHKGVWGLGLPLFDNCLGLGFAPGGTSVVAGVSGAGKTSVLLCWSLYFALQGRKIAYFALEEDIPTLLDGLVSATSAYRYQIAQAQGRECKPPIPAAKLARGDAGPEEEARAVRIIAELSKNIVFVDNPFTKRVISNKKQKPTNVENVQILASLAASTGADIAIYDLWERGLAEGRPFEVEKALELTQSLHKDLGIHGIIAGQINLKDTERGGTIDPARGDIKGVSKLVEIAYQLFMVSRPGMVKGVDNTTRVSIQKQKHGPWPRHTIWDWDGPHKFVSNPRLERSSSGIQDVDDIGIDDSAY